MVEEEKKKRRKTPDDSGRFSSRAAGETSRFKSDETFTPKDTDDVTLCETFSIVKTNTVSRGRGARRRRPRRHADEKATDAMCECALPISPQSVPPRRREPGLFILAGVTPRSARLLGIVAPSGDCYKQIRFLRYCQDFLSCSHRLHHMKRFTKSERASLLCTGSKPLTHNSRSATPNPRTPPIARRCSFLQSDRTRRNTCENNVKVQNIWRLIGWLSLSRGSGGRGVKLKSAEGAALLRAAVASWPVGLQTKHPAEAPPGEWRRKAVSVMAARRSAPSEDGEIESLNGGNDFTATPSGNGMCKKLV